jgi:chromate transporter
VSGRDELSLIRCHQPPALCRTQRRHATQQFGFLPNRQLAIFSLALFAFCLLLVPILAAGKRDGWLPLFDSFYRSGSLVFGGGHVVLPLLQAEVVPKGWVDNNTFLAGYGEFPI